MSPPLRIAFLVVAIALLLASLHYAQTAPSTAPQVAQATAAPEEPAIESMPWWVYLGGIPAVNMALFGLKKVAPRIPAKWVPLIGYGIAGGIAALAGC